MSVGTRCNSKRHLRHEIGRFYGMDPLTELAPMHNPYRFGYNNPVYWKDPSGLIEFEYDKKGNATSAKTSNQEEIAAIMDFFNQNEGASVTELHTFVVENMQSENPTFAFDLEGVTVVGQSKKEKNETLENVIFFNDRLSDGADVLGEVKSKGGSFRLTNGGYNGNAISPKYYGSNWNGGSTAGIKTYNVSKVLRNGTIVTTVVLGAIEMGQGISQDYNNYQDNGYTNGKNTAVASGKVVGGGIGAWAGAKGGAAIGAAFGSVVPIVGTGVGAIVGGIFGAFIGSEVGSSVGKNAVQAAYK
jgi:hypothetical protein